MKNTKRSISLSIATGMLIGLCGTNAATVVIDSTDARGVGTNGFLDTPPVHRIGQGGSSARFATIAIFSVQSILADIQAVDPTFTLAGLATSDFTFTFDTENAFVMPNAGEYTVAYRGFAPNGDTGTQAFWTGLRSYNELTSPSTGVSDTLALQTGITSGIFSLTGITENDTANDYIAVGIGYTSSQPNSNASDVGNFQLNIEVAEPSVIPEPSVALLSGLGLLALLRRRR